jgi:Fe-S-cluster containining protein
MIENNISPELAARLADLYTRMAGAYDRVAGELAFTCEGCPDNCCDSFFLHHTLIEWAYLWQGLQELAPESLQKIKARVESYLTEATSSMAKGERPQVMCPLNDDGLCSLYQHRLMICRMHGVPSKIIRPDGRTMQFPGCFRCQELTAGREQVPEVDRTELYRELAELEQELVKATGKGRPRIKMTIAEMIVNGPPRL